MSLGRLWRDQGKREEARALIASTCDQFTEGLETVDLEEARTLVSELV